MSNSSLKPQDPWEVCRKFRIPGLSHAADGILIERTLSEIPGVRTLSIDSARHQLRVRYSITETDFEAIAGALEAVGFPPADGWWARQRSHWLQNLDLTGRENAAVKPSACCNRPPTPGNRTASPPDPGRH